MGGLALMPCGECRNRATGVSASSGNPETMQSMIETNSLVRARRWDGPRGGWAPLMRRRGAARLPGPSRARTALVPGSKGRSNCSGRLAAAAARSVRAERRCGWRAAAHGPRDRSGMDADDFEDLSIPRRPTWTKSTTAQELDEAERKAFLEWRRGIAQCVRRSRLAARARLFRRAAPAWDVQPIYPALSPRPAARRRPACR